MGRKIDVPDSRIEGLKALVPVLQEAAEQYGEAAWLAAQIEALRPVPKRWSYSFRNEADQVLDWCGVWGGKASPYVASGLTGAKRVGQRLASEHGCLVRVVRTHDGHNYEYIGAYQPLGG